MNTDDFTTISVIRQKQETNKNSFKNNSTENKEDKVNTLTFTSTKITQKQQTTQTTKYYIIVASYPINEKIKAVHEVDKLKQIGYTSAIILPSKERYRVSIEDFDSDKAATEARSKYISTLKRNDLWILRN